MGTVHFRNDHVAAILGFGDLQWGNILVTRVYFNEGLGHNLFSIGQFCDSDLEVAFRRDACFVRNLEGVNLLKGDQFSDDTTPSVSRKFLNDVKSTIVTLQRVFKHRMTLDTHNWSSSTHQELHKIVRGEIFPIVNQVDARVQNFEIQFLKEAAKFVGDFKSLAKEADEPLAKQKALELKIECLLKAVVSQDIMSVVQKAYVVDTSNL
nr:integrase, catalytic region, zinc finger, CCHC-type, peptidase aspartic, catalytic [Tanacetum cinerariifolium]